MSIRIVKKNRIAAVLAFLAVLICAVIAGVALHKASPVGAAYAENTDTSDGAVMPLANGDKTALPVPVIDTSKSVIYNGGIQTVTIINYDENFMTVSSDKNNDDLPDNQGITAGNYNLSISLNDTANYCWEDAGKTTAAKTLSWTLEKQQLDVPVIDTNKPVVYDGTKQTVTITYLNEALMTVSSDKNNDNLPDNQGVTARNYELSISLNDTANYCWKDAGKTTAAKTLSWTLEKRNLDEVIDALEWKYSEKVGDDDYKHFVYDNKVHKVELGWKENSQIADYLKEYIQIDYENKDPDDPAVGNEKINAGKYKAKARLLYDNVNFTLSQNKSLPELEWNIYPGTYDMSNVAWRIVDETVGEDGLYHIVYNGTPKVVELTGLPDGVTVKNYTGTYRATNAGYYSASISLGDSDFGLNYDSVNYEKPDFSTAPANFNIEFKWNIGQATYSMTGVRWNYSADSSDTQYYRDFVYDGTMHSVELVGTLPSGVSVSSNGYYHNSAMDAGTYHASVEFDYDTVNYEKPTVAECEWVIRKADLKDATITMTTDAAEIIYNPNKPWEPEFLVSFHTLSSLDYDVSWAKNNKASVTELAELKLTAKTNSINFTGSITYYFEIRQATLDLSGIMWNYSETDGNAYYKHFIYEPETVHTVELIGLPDVLEAVYTAGYVHSATDADIYSARASLQFKDSNEAGNYSTNINEFYDLTWQIYKRELVKPTAATGLVYNSTTQLGLTGYDENTMTASGHQERNAGEGYVAVVGLKNTDNYQWNDGTVASFEVEWSIARANINNLPYLNVSQIRYDETERTTRITNYDPGRMRINLPLNWQIRDTNTLVIPQAPNGVYSIEITPDANHKWSDTDSVVSETATRYLPFYIYYNIGSGGSFSAKDIAMLMGKVMGRSSSVASYGELLHYMDSHDKRTGAEINAVVGIDGRLWQVVLATKSISGDVSITLWYLGNEQEMQNQWSNGWINESSDVAFPSNMYSSSYIRSILSGSPYTADGTKVESTIPNWNNSVWGKFTTSYGNYILTPSQLSYQENLTGYINERYGEGDAYTNKQNYGIWSQDKLWLPGATETGDINTVGVWGLVNASNFYGNYWLRSGAYDNASLAYYSGFKGTFSNNVTASYAVRPAFHFNLKLVAQAAGLIMDVPHLSDESKEYSTEEIRFSISDFNKITVVSLPESIIDGIKQQWYMSGTEVVVPKRTPVNNSGYIITVKPVEGYCWNDGNFGSGNKDLVFNIKKAEYVMSDVKWIYYDDAGNKHNYYPSDLSTPFTYKFGTERRVEVDPDTLPDGLYIIGYDGNAYTDAGTNYCAKVIFGYDSDNYLEPEFNDLNWWIAKASVETLSLRWQDDIEFTYDGRRHQVSVVGLPENSDITVRYEGVYYATNADNYTAKVIFEYDENNYVGITLKDCEWKINEKELPVPTVTEKLIYNGKLQSILETDSDGKFKYIENFDSTLMNINGYEGTYVRKKEVGDTSSETVGYYTATVTFKTPQNYRWETTDEDEVEVRWYILKADYDMSKTEWDYDATNNPIRYNGLEHKILLTGYPSEKITPHYVYGLKTENIEDFKQTPTVNVGTYIAKISGWTYDTDNYNEPIIPDLEWEISKGIFDVSKIAWNYIAGKPQYNGQTWTVEVTGYPEGLTPTYLYEMETSPNVFVESPTVNAGTYRATVTFLYDSDNYEIPDFTNTDFEFSIIWQISKADYDLSKVYWDYTEAFEYDGDVKRVLLVGLPDSLQVTYSGNEAFNAGVYTAVVTGFTCNDDNYNIPDSASIKSLDWVVNKANYDMSKVAWNYSIDNDGDRFTFDGQRKNVRLINLPTGIEVKEYLNADAIDADTYFASVVSFDYNEQNYNVPEMPSGAETCEWRINKATVNSSDVSWNIDGGNSYSFDGLNHVPTATVEFNGATYALSVNLSKNGVDVPEAVNVGTYTATAADSKNFILVGEPTTRELSVTKTILTESNIRWSFSDGAKFKTGSKPEISAVIRIGEKEFPVELVFERQDGGNLEDWADGIYTATVKLADGEDENFGLPVEIMRNFRLDSSVGNQGSGSFGFILDNRWKLMIIINAVVVFVLTVALVVFILVKRHSVNEIHNGVDDGDGFYDAT